MLVHKQHNTINCTNRSEAGEMILLAIGDHRVAEQGRVQAVPQQAVPQQVSSLELQQ
jgi:hypothetical protein